MCYLERQLPLLSRANLDSAPKLLFPKHAVVKQWGGPHADQLLYNEFSTSSILTLDVSGICRRTREFVGKRSNTQTKPSDDDMRGIVNSIMYMIREILDLADIKHAIARYEERPEGANRVVLPELIRRAADLDTEICAKLQYSSVFCYGKKVNNRS